MKYEQWRKNLVKKAASHKKAQEEKPKASKVRIIWDEDTPTPGWYVRFENPDGEEMAEVRNMPDEYEKTEQELGVHAEDSISWAGYSFDPTVDDFEIIA